jgi:hypothetical protein
MKKIVNTDQDSQFPAAEFVKAVGTEAAGPAWMVAEPGGIMFLLNDYRNL